MLISIFGTNWPLTIDTHSPVCLAGMSEDILALGSYCLSSIAMTLLNKAVLSSSNFHMNFLLLAIQALCSVGLLLSFRKSGLIAFRPLNKPDAIQWLPVSLLLICMIYTGSKAIQYLTVAMFTVFKNLTIIVVALGEQHFFASKITPLMWCAFALMVVGSVVGGFNDLKFNALGYMWMVLNSASSAAYLLYMKRTIKFVNFADFDSSFYSNVISLPILLVLSLIFENWPNFINRFFTDSLINNAWLVFGMACSGLSGFAISYSTAWCVRVCMSTTFSMVGALNKLPVTVSGLIFFASERAAVNFGYLLSIVISFASGLVYSYAQILKKRETVPAKESPSMQSRSSIITLEKRTSSFSDRAVFFKTHELIPLQQTNK